MLPGSESLRGHDVPFSDDHEELGSSEFVAIYINILAFKHEPLLIQRTSSEL